MKHSIDPPCTETLAELGKQIGLLRYDALRRVLQELAAEIATQAVNDHHAGKPQLSLLGEDASQLISQASAVVDEMFGISASYMKDDLINRPAIPHKIGF